MPGLPGTQPAPDPRDGRRLALVVATTRYADTSLRQLRAPARDAVDLRDLLADPQVGGFAVTSVVDGTAQQIRLSVEEFLSGRSLDDLLVVYLSCHGLVDLRRRLYFAATDTLKNRLAATGVEAQWLLDQLDDCRARRQVVILDCCFSGAFAHGAKGGDADLALGERFHGQGRGRVVLTASRGSEYSFEGEPVPGSAMPGSVFTSALVAGIRSGAADNDHDGYISVDDAYAYAFDQIRAADVQQTPQRWLYGAEGTILLARSPAGITITPADVPETLRAGLDSSHPAIRLGAVAALGEWLADADPARVLAARQALRQVADTDIPRVATAAQTLLDPPQSQPSPHHGRPGTETETPAPVPADRWRRLWPFGRASRSLPAQSAEGATRGPSRPAVTAWSRRRRLVYAAAAALVVAAAGVAVTALILDRGGPSGQAGPPAGNEITAAEPWRLFVTNTTDDGCGVTVTNTDTGDPKVFANIWGEQQFQMQATGTFRWEADDPGCLVVKHAGPGNATLPFSEDAGTGDTDVFAAPKAPGKVIVQVKEFNSYGRCRFELRDAADGQRVDVRAVQNGEDPRVPLDPNGRSHVYLAAWDGCTIHVSI
ncbi:MAG: caspase family protein, partial [Kribbellaceae bacterium]